MSALVIGYGNPLRADDGAGWHVAGRLAGDPRAAGATVLACHQLTPELAEDVSRSDRVVFVDASVEGGPPGTVWRTELDPPAAAPAWSHHVGPGRLLELAATLYGHAPPAAIVHVGAGDLGAGTALSEAVEGAMAEAVGAVLRELGRA